MTNEWNLIHLVRGGLHYMKLSGGGGEHYLKPENDVPYHVCSVSIARSLTLSIHMFIDELCNSLLDYN